MDRCPASRSSDLGATAHTINSSLTAVDLGGLTQLELAFAVLLIAAAAGLVLGLSLAERQRTFAIRAALGARTRQLGAFVWSEGLLVFVGGNLVGILLGFGIAQMLVVLLTGVFDPPPEALAVPWSYVSTLLVTGGAAMVLAVLTVLAAPHAPWSMRCVTCERRTRANAHWPPDRIGAVSEKRGREVDATVAIDKERS